MATNSYRYLITEIYMPAGNSSNPVLAELPFTNVNFVQQLNGIGSFQGELLLAGMPSALDTVNQTTPMQKALFVDHNGQIIWAGIITGRTYDSDAQKISINAQEYEYLLQKRRINLYTGSAYYSSGAPGLVYTNIDAGTILYDIVNNTQVNHSASGSYPAKRNTNIGISPDLFTTGSLVTRTYYDFELKSVYQALKDLSQGSFFDFKIIAQYDAYQNIVLSMKVGAPAVANSPLNRTYNASTPSQAFVFNFPGNLTSYKYIEDGTRVANYAWGLGYGANNNKVLVAKTDTSKTGVGYTWPFLEDALNFIDVKDSNTLGVMTAGIASGISYPPTTFQVSLPPWVDPPLGAYGVSYSYTIGDQVRLVIKDEFWNLDYTNYRITEIEVTPGSNGPDKVTITLMLPYATIS